jgi:catechol O-methyltransferase
MNVGPYKGKVVTELIAKESPEVFVELGGYCGYSAILFGDALRKAGGKKYYSLELKPQFAAVSRKLLELAGLSDLITVIVGPAAEGLQGLKESQKMERIDMLFLDHHKPLYKSDLQAAENIGLIDVGTILAADNVIYPGNPEYLEYVRTSTDSNRICQYSSELINSFEPTGDIVSIHPFDSNVFKTYRAHANSGWSRNF